MPEGIPQVDGVEHRFVQAGRLRMHVAEAGAGEPILMLHGWPQHWYVWRGVIPLLAPHARVICPDLRGFGWTDAPPGGYAKETMADDVLRLIDALGLERVRLVAHDWGGWIGFLLCLRRPERFEHYLALNIPPPWPAPDRPGPLEAARLVYQLVLAAPGLGRGPGARTVARLGLRSGELSEADSQAFLDRLTGSRGRATELLYRTFLLRELVPVLRGRYAPQALSVPTRLLFGVDDVAISERSVRLAASLSSAIEYEPVPGAGHFLADQRPELVAERALATL